jgi:hypothetical protein
MRDLASRRRGLDAGRATLELAITRLVDEVEVGRRVAVHLRVAFGVADAAEATDRLLAAGAELIARPVETPWRSLNARLNGPAGLQLTLFEELEPAGWHVPVVGSPRGQRPVARPILRR